MIMKNTRTRWFTLLALSIALFSLAPTAIAGPDAARLETVRTELLDLAQRDREARAALIGAWVRDGEGGFTIDGDIMNAVMAIDAESQAYLEALVDEMGWPTISMVGEDGSGAAWLLVQHADDDVAFQARVLELMEPMLANEEILPQHYALLKDRVLLAKGEPQVYGTQFQDDGTGVLRPKATEDWDGLEARRLSVGLPPLAEYAESLKETYDQPYELTPLPLANP